MSDTPFFPWPKGASAREWNRRAALRETGVQPRAGAPDVELILRAYLAWGTRCLYSACCPRSIATNLSILSRPDDVRALATYVSRMPSHCAAALFTARSQRAASC